MLSSSIFMMIYEKSALLLASFLVRHKNQFWRTTFHVGCVAKKKRTAKRHKRQTKNKKRKKGKETVLRSRERSEDPRYQNHAIYEL